MCQNNAPKNNHLFDIEKMSNTLCQNNVQKAYLASVRVNAIFTVKNEKVRNALYKI